MRERLEKRVSELETELHAGQQMLAELEAKRADIQQTLLRITGAIQVLNELLAAEPRTGPVAADGTGPASPAAPERRVPEPL
ncbi:hypothetical protein ACN27F_28670 [Solwaraspora sp. WMMB335]|uniref:hypothetical protein n=1 Tax=Solwaraspora sp. WMMB335 TaxID=3404118 RepID=UPI003B925A54